LIFDFSRNHLFFTLRQAPASSALASRNGWTPDESAFAFGLPGTIAPVPDFDPFGFATNADLDTMVKYREAETQHGRVAMLAAVGFLVGENYHPLFGLDGKEILAIDSLTEVRLVFPAFFEILTAVIGILELNRAVQGFMSPKDAQEKMLKSEYYPGDVQRSTLVLRTGMTGELTAPSASPRQKASPRGGELDSTPNEMAPSVKHQCPSGHNKLGFLTSCFQCCGIL